MRRYIHTYTSLLYCCGETDEEIIKVFENIYLLLQKEIVQKYILFPDTSVRRLENVTTLMVNCVVMVMYNTVGNEFRLEGNLLRTTQNTKWKAIENIHKIQCCLYKTYNLHTQKVFFAHTYYDVI